MFQKLQDRMHFAGLINDGHGDLLHKFVIDP